MRKLLLTLLCLVALLGSTVLPSLPAEASSTTIYVPDNYSTIQAAVDAAAFGDTIIVSDGTYIENIDVSKRIVIKSQNGAAATTVQAASSSDHVFEVTVDYVTITGFTVTGANANYKAGIYLGNGVDHCTISDNIASSDIFGISLDGSSHNIIFNNQASANTQGIRLYSSAGNIVAGNTTDVNSGDGIELFGSNDNIISGNVASSNTGAGIVLDYWCSNNTISHNSLSGSWRGIYLFNSSSYNTVSRNVSSGNNYGIDVYGSGNNVIYLNDFSSNNWHVRSNSTDNTWNSAAAASYVYNGNTYTNHLGNYWSDYGGTDADGDGIGDTVYNIATDNDDNYPLIETMDQYMANQAPVLDPIGHKTVEEGQLLSFTISATDPDGDALAFSSSNLPSGASFDPLTRTFNWTPTHEQAGVCRVHFEVSDGQLTDSEDIAITINGGIISSNTTWRLADSPYILATDILVSPGITLTIEPGVIVKSSSGVTLRVDGQLIARGTEANPILFTSNELPPQPGNWKWIQFTDSSVDATYGADGNYAGGSILEYCTVEYGGDSYWYTVLQVESSSPCINHCNISNNRGGIRVEQGSLRITNNTIRNNGGSGIFVHGTVTISGNTIESNSGDVGGGIYAWGQATITDNVIRGNWANIDGGGIYACYDTMTINGNTIEDNHAQRNGGGIVLVAGTATISGNIIQDNSAGDGGGIYCGLGAGQGAKIMKYNTISGNSATAGKGGGIYGIYLDAWSSAAISYNNIHSNTPFDFYNYQSNDIDAGNNWWGTTDEASIQAHIYDRSDDASLGVVNYIPYLTGQPAGNQPPALDPIGDQAVDEGQELSFTISGSDPEGDALTFSASNVPDGASFDPSTHIFSWTPTYGQAGTYPGVHFEVSDGCLIDSWDITICVNNVNRAPVLDPIGDQTVDEGQELSFTISVSDPDGDALTFSVFPLPSGASFDPTTKTFSWMPTYEQAGTYPGVRFEVSDGSLADSEDVTICVNNVNRAPMLDPTGDKTVRVGRLLSFSISASDPDGDALIFSASNLPDGASFDPTTQTFSWTPTNEQVGAYPEVRFQASDGLLTSGEDITVTVLSVTAEYPFNYTISGAGTEDVAIYPDQEFNWTVTTTGTETWIGYGLVDPGNYYNFAAGFGGSTAWAYDRQVYVCVWGIEAGSATYVTPPAGFTITGWDYTVESSSLGGGDAGTYLDAAHNQLVICAYSGGMWLWFMGCPFPLVGMYQATYRIYGVGPMTATVTAAESGSGRVNASEGDKLIASFSLDPPPAQNGGTVTVDSRTVSSDNPNVTVTIIPEPAGEVYASTEYSEVATQPWSALETGSVAVSAADGEKYIITSSLAAPNGDTSWSVMDDSWDVDTWMVGDRLYALLLNQAPVLDAIGDQAVNEGQLLQFTISASDPNGDALSFWADNLPDGASFDPSTQTFTWTPVYGQAGTYSDVHFEVSDGSLADSEDITITVNDVGQVVTFPDPNLESAIREAIGKSAGDIYQLDLDGLTELDANAKGIVDLTGLEYCTSLTLLYLAGNQISDILPLVNNPGLAAGDTVDLRSNPLTVTSLETGIPQLEARGVNVLYTTPPPRADFSATPVTGSEPLAVSFTDLSSSYDGIVTWWWDFGDSETSIERNPSHVYAQNGIYTVSLMVTEADGDSATCTGAGYVVVNDTGPVADFSGTPLTGDEPLTVFFTGLSISYDGIVTWWWDFGDSETSIERNPFHVYAQNGIYTVSLMVTEADGDSATATKVGCVAVNDAEPVADFSGAPLTGDEPLAVTFTDLSISYDGIVTWWWDFGDGGWSSEQNPSHTYIQNGTYTVSLMVTEADGDSAIATKVGCVAVNDTGPVADFSGAPLTGDEPLTVFFTDLSISYDGIVTWWWDFGDGGWSSEQNPSHTYIQNGIYTVSLMVTEADGDSATCTGAGYVVVNDTGPVADFSGTPLTGDEPLTVFFTDLSISYDGIVSWWWDFGDGQTSTQQNPTHLYAQDGTYTVSLTVAEADGDSATCTRAGYIQVKRWVTFVDQRRGTMLRVNTSDRTFRFTARDGFDTGPLHDPDMVVLNLGGGFPGGPSLDSLGLAQKVAARSLLPYAGSPFGEEAVFILISYRGAGFSLLASAVAGDSNACIARAWRLGGWRAYSLYELPRFGRLGMSGYPLYSSVSGTQLTIALSATLGEQEPRGIPLMGR